MLSIGTLIVSSLLVAAGVFILRPSLHMPSLADIRVANGAFSPSHPPVALFVGGTSGVGQGMAEVFARHTKGNAHIIIIGRNRAAAESIISTFPQPTIAGVQHEFIYCDVTLMKNIHTVTTELLLRVPKINYLVMSPGFMSMKGREETEEGIDTKLAVKYYSRWKFTNDLLPALLKAKEAGEEAKVLSIGAPGKGGAIDLDDLGLKKAYSVANVGLSSPTYNDLMVEEFAARNPELTFIHAYPGFVRTGLLRSSDSFLLKSASSLVYGLTYPLSVSAETCGEYMLHALFNSTKGAFRTGSKGEDLGNKRYFGSDEARKRLWDHSLESTLKRDVTGSVSGSGYHPP